MPGKEYGPFFKGELPLVHAGLEEAMVRVELRTDLPPIDDKEWMHLLDERYFDGRLLSGLGKGEILRVPLEMRGFNLSILGTSILRLVEEDPNAIANLLINRVNLRRGEAALCLHGQELRLKAFCFLNPRESDLRAGLATLAVLAYCLEKKTLLEMLERKTTILALVKREKERKRLLDLAIVWHPDRSCWLVVEKSWWLIAGEEEAAPGVAARLDELAFPGRLGSEDLLVLDIQRDF